MKYCPKCEITKELNEFYTKGKNRLQPYCKPCFNQYCIERWIARKIEIIKYKGGKCIKCSYSKFYGALELHHREKENKEFDWNKLRLMSWEKIKLEADKCDLVCSNCHTEIHGNALP